MSPPLEFEVTLQHLKKLSDAGVILYFDDKTTKRNSWVVGVDESITLLREVTGSLFCPTKEKRFPQLNDTGIWPKSKIKEKLHSLDINFELIMTFFEYFQFCHRDSRNLMNTRYTDEDSDKETSYYFFPALLNEELPRGKVPIIWQQSNMFDYRFGWCLACMAKGERVTFFTTRFLHDMILELTLLYAEECSGSEGGSFKRKCMIWKNGITWSQDGVVAHFELPEEKATKHRRSYTFLFMACTETKKVECVKLRSELMQHIRSYHQKHSPHIPVQEFFLDPRELLAYPLENFEVQKLTFIIDIEDVAMKIQKYSAQKGNVYFSAREGEVSSKLSDILVFEPYTQLSQPFIEELFNEEQTKEVSEQHINKLAKQFGNSWKTFLREMFIPKMEDIDTDILESSEKTLHVWKEHSHQHTYKDLREALDRFSIFGGRNPLKMRTKPKQNEDQEPVENDATSNPNPNHACFDEGARPLNLLNWNWNIISTTIFNHFKRNWKSIAMAFLLMILLITLLGGVDSNNGDVSIFPRKPAEFRNLIWMTKQPDIISLHKHWKESWPLLILYGPPGVGKTSLALEISHTLSVQQAFYINCAEFFEINGEGANDEYYLSVAWLQWLKNVTEPTVILLDDYKLKHFDIEIFLKSLLLSTVNKVKQINIILVTEDDQVPNIYYESPRFHVGGFNNSQAFVLLRRCFPAFDKNMILPILNVSIKSPLSLILIIGTLKITQTASLEVLSRLSEIKTRVSENRYYEEPMVLSRLIYELLPPIDKGCARYLSRFPISFPEQAAIEVLSMCGFSRSNLCLQSLVNYSILDSYMTADKVYFKMPKLVKMTLQEQCKANELFEWNESAVFNASFCRYYQSLQTKHGFLDIWQTMLNHVVQEPIEVYKHRCSGIHIGIEWKVKNPRYEMSPGIKFILHHKSSKLILKEWRQMGKQLDMPELTLDMIEKYYQGNTEEQCFEMFYRWMKLETGLYPVTWDGLLAMLRDSDMEDAYEHFKKGLKLCRNTTPYCSGESWRREEPPFKLLERISYIGTDGNEQTFRFITEVKGRCMPLGIALGMSYNEIDNWDRENPRYLEGVAYKIMNKWLQNGARVTWGGLLTALEDAQLSDIARQLENALHSYYNTTLPRV